MEVTSGKALRLPKRGKSSYSLVMSSLPRYRQIANDLRGRLAAGEFPVGTQLPGITALQEQYNALGLNMIREAEAVLQAEGLIVAQQGRGTFVIALPTSAETVLATDVARLRELLDEAATVLTRIERAMGETS